ncbi:MAG: hypothetical protein M1819_006018 [Sarea resinae]|nr:MAG: hypothetical protein M1819_006018 [Sarea resinae]
MGGSSHLTSLIAVLEIISWEEALSGIFGSISLAAWVFLLVPQLVENYKQGSAEGISLAFLVVWFIGDIANFFGALWAGLVPTVTALAVYFCIADLVLITQCLYYNSRNSRKAERASSNASTSLPPNDPHRPLLESIRRSSDDIGIGSRRRSSASHCHRDSHGSSLRRDSLSKLLEEESPRASWIKKIVTIFLICAAGTGGWFVAWKSGVWTPTEDGGRSADVAFGAQILGYLSAICYLGARVPQIIKNHRERSCEGLSILFFILSLMGNATYGAGILFHSTAKDYVVTNLPWLIGSLGTMVEDVVIFIQFHIYTSDSSHGNTSAIE